MQNEDPSVCVCMCVCLRGVSGVAAGLGGLYFLQACNRVQYTWAFNRCKSSGAVFTALCLESA